MTTFILLCITGIVLILASAFINYHIGRRRFYRRNAAGVEVFASYGRFRLVRWLEYVAVFWGMLFRTAGILLLLFALVERKDLINGWGRQPTKIERKN